jgi:hypothetical protein
MRSTGQASYVRASIPLLTLSLVLWYLIAPEVFSYTRDIQKIYYCIYHALYHAVYFHIYQNIYHGIYHDIYHDVYHDVS